ncbi:hypothetical protein YC2023_005021 [Brassica napus]
MDNIFLNHWTDRGQAKLNRYAATKHAHGSTRYPTKARNRSLRSDRTSIPLGRGVAIEPFRTSIRHQSLHSRQTFEYYLPKNVAISIHVSRYSNSSIKLRGSKTAENS